MPLESETSSFHIAVLYEVLLETTAPAAAGPTKAALCHCPVTAPPTVYPSLMLETPTLCQKVLSLPSRVIARASLNHAASTARA